MSQAEYIFGIHAVAALIKNAPQRILHVFVQQDRNDPQIQKILTQARAEGLAVQMVPRAKLDQLLPQTTHQGIVATCRMAENYTENDIETLLSNTPQKPLVLILDGVQDPHNLGACLRSADAAGVHLLLAPKDASVGLTPIVRKVACGAAETVPFIQVTNLARTLRQLRDMGIWLYGAAGDANNSLYATDLRGAVGLILGSEGKGLRRLTRDVCDDLIYIPMSGTVSSLNVSVATGVCLFEAVRQRGAAA